MRWTRKYKNMLPDTAFLFVERGGRKDASGRTVPRTLRHLPIYDLHGHLSLNHVRSVLSSYGQRANIPADAKAEAIAFALRLLHHHGGKSGKGVAEHGPSSGVRVKPARALPAAGKHKCAHCKQIIKGVPTSVHTPGEADKHYHSSHVRHHGKQTSSHHRRAA